MRGENMNNALFKDEKYSGQYVAVKSIDEPVVITSGKDPVSVHSEASRKGYVDFLILFVPEKDLVHIY